MVKISGIDAITFDCYGTLVDWRRGIAEYVYGMVSDHAMAYAVTEEWIKEDITRVSSGYKPYSQIAAENLEEAMRRLGIEYRREYGDGITESIPTWPLFPDTKGSLERLKEIGYKLFIISNMESRILEKTIENSGLDVDGYYAAEMAKVYKPNPRVLFGAYKRFGIPIWRGLHVSSSIDHDIRPAMVLGLKTAWVNRYGEPEPEEGIATEYIVGSLEELADALGSGNEGRSLEGWLEERDANPPGGWDLWMEKRKG